MASLDALNIDVKIWTMPVEVPDPIPFEQDKIHAAYDRQHAERLRRVLVSIDDVFKVFRARFIGKSSPVHFFLGGFYLALTPVSRRRAPERKDPDPLLPKVQRRT